MRCIHHTAFHCADISVMEQFYSKYFGFKRARTFNAGTENEFIMLKTNNSYIELFKAKGNEKSSDTGAPGFKHLAFSVENLSETITFFNKNGIATEEVIDLSHISPGFNVCFLSDPEGNTIELVQGYIDEF